jgi:hypothetical protein
LVSAAILHVGDQQKRNKKIRRKSSQNDMINRIFLPIIDQKSLVFGLKLLIFKTDFWISDLEWLNFGLKIKTVTFFK